MNNTIQIVGNDKMKQDDLWLGPWTDEIAGRKVLELGCGKGIDSRFIAQHAHYLVACDINPTKHLYGTALLCVDHSQRLPFKDACFDLVIASLCLHYFDHEKTSSILEEIARVLSKGGALICRLNSSKDINSGAIADLEMQTHLVRVNEQLKCFFDEETVKGIFSGKWKLMSLVEKNIDRYEKNKVVWELFSKLI